MCLEQCLSIFCCVSNKWKMLLLTSMLGTALTIFDIYSDIFVAIDFVYQGNQTGKYYWAAAAIAVIIISNLFITRAVILVMKPHSMLTVFCIGILSMLGFGPIVLLCFLFFDGDDDLRHYYSSPYLSRGDHSKLDPTSDAYNYFLQILLIRACMAKMSIVESFCESMLSASLQIAYLILSDESHSQHWMLIISSSISIFSFGSGLTKWVRNYVRVTAFHSLALYIVYKKVYCRVKYILY